MLRKYEMNLPEEFSTIAKATFYALNGTLYAVGNAFVLTDESGNLENPRCTVESLYNLEQWLLITAVAWMTDAVKMEDTMLEALEEHLQLRHRIRQQGLAPKSRAGRNKEKRFEIDVPRNFSTSARAAFYALDGTLYAIGNQLIYTDESKNVEMPYISADSYEELEAWLLQCAIDWINDCIEEGLEGDAMFDAINDCLELW